MPFLRIGLKMVVNNIYDLPSGHRPRDTKKNLI